LKAIKDGIFKAEYVPVKISEKEEVCTLKLFIFKDRI